MFVIGGGVSTAQMMFAVNAFSVIFCLVSLLQQWTLVESIHFLLEHEQVARDCLLLSVGSALGQVTATGFRFPKN